MFQRQTILITGGSGLLALNWFFTKRTYFTIYLGLNEKKIKPPGANVVQLDYSSEERLINQVKLISPVAIIHTAGLTSVEECEFKPELAYHVNVNLSKIIAKVTQKLCVPMVHISTDHLYSGDASLYSEKEILNPINFYGKTKALAEEIVLEYNPNALIVRTNFYGFGTSYRKSFSDHIIDSLRKRSQLYLFDDVFFTPILAEILIHTVHNLLEKNAKGIYNIVSDDRLSKYDFGVLVAEEFSLDKGLIQRCTFQSRKDLVLRPLDMSLSNFKVCELLGRNLGRVKDHLAVLRQQENKGELIEMRVL